LEDGAQVGAFGVEGGAKEKGGSEEEGCTAEDGCRCGGSKEKSLARVDVCPVAVKIKIAWIGKTKEPAIQALTDEYLKRIARYVPVEGLALRDEAALLQLPGKQSGGKVTLVLMDSGGKQFSSEEFAKFLGDYQDRNPLPLIFAVGGADGFSAAARAAAQTTISLGKMTLAHELARVVLLEQVYRAFTILKGHPYHSGH
jgi:23S rRNA (pseudouridine1915-N3)-methyltransferase